MTHLLHLAQFDQPFAQQTQAPLPLPFRLLPTGQGDKVGFLLSIENALLGPFRLGATVERIIESMLNEGMTYPTNR
jgi:hypothetical protein